MFVPGVKPALPFSSAGRTCFPEPTQGVVDPLYGIIAGKSKCEAPDFYPPPPRQAYTTLVFD